MYNADYTNIESYQTRTIFGCITDLVLKITK